jgi:ABC-type cobalamin/Fe3+-siderophores transport system ATPase subunit
VVTIRDGRIHGDGPKEQALTSAALESLFGIPVEALERAGYYHVL